MTHRKLSVALLALAAALTMSACGGGNSAAPASSPSTSTSSASTPATAPSLDRSQCQDPYFARTHAEFCANVPDTTMGPATSTAAFPGTGLEARVLSVKIGPADPTRPGKANETTLVTITIELKNTATEPFVFSSAGNSVTELLLHGQDLYEATSWTVSPGGRNDLPARLTTGSTTTTTSQFTAPASVPLSFSFNPSSQTLPTYTFAGVETLAR
ncbi:hypothetical protein JNUCC0626_18410 [Lentzea sp. JNUCC 0626]|uniref:hypothetical protein n=1 Tax=Lentzea sp. JNUCC 0626 TaxID=3367513 RepID=UPI00374A14F2